MKAYLYERRDTWQILLKYNDADNATKQKWVNTKLPIKGNKRKAAALVESTIETWQPILEPESSINSETIPYIEQTDDTKSTLQAVTKPVQPGDNILFVNFLDEWLQNKRRDIDDSTFGGYQVTISKIIRPYFEPKKLTLSEISAEDILQFYEDRRKDGVSENTLLHYNTIINQTFRKAVVRKKITINPVTLIDKSEKPKKSKYTPRVCFKTIKVTKREYKQGK